MPKVFTRDEHGFSSREVEVLGLLHLRNKEIAKRLGITVRTAEKHLEVIINRLGVVTRTDAMLVGLAKGMIKNPYEPK